MDDLGRLRDRVNKLGTHFAQANEDVRQILISAEKVEKRGARIRDVRQGPAGAVYALTDQSRGRLLRLTPQSQTSQQPK